MTDDKNIFIKAFPSSWTMTVNSLLNKIELKAEHNPTECFTVITESEKIHIPYRIYYKEPDTANLTDNEAFIIDCFFTRHNDGRVREKCLKSILTNRNYVTTPFIVQLLGEYVVEILQIVHENLDNTLLDNFLKFKIENPQYFETTRQRIESYYDCYYKSSSRPKDSYPGFQILNAIAEREKLTA